MKFSDFICKEAVRTHLEADEKETVIRAMGKALVEAGKIKEQDFESIVAAILKREELGSTGIGRGVAVPHTKHPAVSKLVGTVAISDEGVDFDSLDGEKVHLLFLLISPPDRPGDHLRALENVVNAMRDENLVKALRTAATKDDIWKALDGGGGTGP